MQFVPPYQQVVVAGGMRILEYQSGVSFVMQMINDVGHRLWSHGQPVQRGAADAFDDHRTAGHDHRTVVLGHLQYMKSFVATTTGGENEIDAGVTDPIERRAVGWRHGAVRGEKGAIEIDDQQAPLSGHAVTLGRSRLDGKAMGHLPVLESRAAGP